MINEGHKFPSGSLLFKDNAITKEINTDEFFKNKKVVLFGLPGAFSGTCSQKHLPGFIKYADTIKDKGYDIACISVNDPHVMKAWGDISGVESKISMLSDSDCSITKALGLDKDFGKAMGIRSKRYAMIIDNGIINKNFVDESGFNFSSAENILKNI